MALTALVLVSFFLAPGHDIPEPPRPVASTAAGVVSDQGASALRPGGPGSGVDDELRRATDSIFLRRAAVDSPTTSAEPETGGRAEGLAAETLGLLDPEENPTIWEGARRAVEHGRRDLAALRGTIDPRDPEDLTREAAAILRLTKAEAIQDSLQAGRYRTVPLGDGSKLLGNTEEYIFVLSGGARIGERWVDLVYALSLERYPELKHARDHDKVIATHTRRMMAYEINSLPLEERLAIADAFDLLRNTRDPQLTTYQKELVRKWMSADIGLFSFFDQFSILRVRD